jgi:glycosyltransferase involved in cell wall biosynthesis
MKICLIADGTSLHTQKWANYLVSLEHEVHVIAERFNINYEGFDDRITKYQLIHFSPGLWKLTRFFAGALWIYQTYRLIHRLRPDILNAHYVNTAGYLGAICGFHPLVITAWGSDILIVPKQNRILGAFTKWALKRADLVMCVSLQMKEVIIKMGIQPDRIMVTPIGVNCHQFRPEVLSDSVLFPKLSENHILRVISTRNLTPTYDVETLIKAAPTILRMAPKSEFIILGDGESKKELHNLVENLDVAGKVSFRGFVPRNDLPMYLNSSDIYVSTSLSDGASISLLEAMACGLPCVVSDIPANRPWISEGENGLLFQPGDYNELAAKILSLLDNKELRTRMGLAARQRVIEKGNEKTEMAKVEEAYIQLVKNK